MPRSYKLSWYYQNDEEILSTSVWYVDPNSPVSIAPEDLSNLAAAFIANIDGNAELIFGEDVYSHGAEVTTPSDGVTGPARWIDIHAETVGDLSNPPAPDILVMNATLRGTASNGDAVSGGLRLAGWWESKVNCNNIEEAYAVQAEAALNEMFPQFLTGGSVSFVRSIKHKLPNGDYEFVPAPNLSINRQASTMLERVGNRGQGKPSRQMTEPGEPDPT